jgi:hypothetical protein
MKKKNVTWELECFCHSTDNCEDEPEECTDSLHVPYHGSQCLFTHIHTQGDGDELNCPLCSESAT